MSGTVYGLLLTAKGDIKKSKISDNASEKLTLEALGTILKRKTAPKKLGSYKYNQQYLTLFGYTEGRAGTENKHDLPPPCDSALYFGDILLIASKGKSWNEKYLTITPADYEKFYHKSFAGFEDIEDSEEESIDESESETEDENIEEDEADAEGVADEEDESEISEVESEESEEEVDVEEEEAPRKPTKKKAVSTKVNLTVQSNTGRAKQQQVMSKLGYQEYEFENMKTIPNDTSKEAKNRNKVLSILRTQFKEMFSEDQCKTLENVILHITFQECGKKEVMKHFENPLFENLYQMVARRMIGNLMPSSYVQNKDLLQKLLNGNLDFEHLRSMGVMDLAPNLYEDMRNRQILREQSQLEGNKALATNRFQCNRCHKRECTYYELQTRSADEPTTIFVNCLNCGKRWRQ